MDTAWEVVDSFFFRSPCRDKLDLTPRTNMEVSKKQRPHFGSSLRPCYTEHRIFCSALRSLIFENSHIGILTKCEEKHEPPWKWYHATKCCLSGIVYD